VERKQNNITVKKLLREKLLLNRVIFIWFIKSKFTGDLWQKLDDNIWLFLGNFKRRKT